MNIQKDLLTISPFSRPGKKLIGVKGIVVHWTGNPGSTAKQNRNYFESLKTQSSNGDRGPPRWASAHFIAGLSGEAVQCIPADETAYHAGADSYTPEALERLGSYPNNCTIGIELCHPGTDGRFTEETLQAAAELCALLCAEFSLDPVKDIWRHYDITGKDCPKWFVSSPEDFQKFKNRAGAAACRARG
jgi:N-acetylmuramoyl-L-alanine amidase